MKRRGSVGGEKRIVYCRIIQIVYERTSMYCVYACVCTESARKDIRYSLDEKKMDSTAKPRGCIIKLGLDASIILHSSPNLLGSRGAKYI